MHKLSRREAIRCSLAMLGSVAFTPQVLADEPSRFKLATFSADVTPRLGHPLLGGHFAPARSIDDLLFARGLVLTGGEQPVVLVSVDWCEIRNDAYERWRNVLAEAAGTTPNRVLVTSVHQHDAPLADLTAQRLLAASGADAMIIDADFHERTVQSVVAALRASLAEARPVTHFGIGQAKVEQVASNRRVVDAAGKASFARYSATREAAIRDLPEGLIDPWLKVISFWNGEQPLAAINAYATHPMSYYGGGAISSDFVGLARAKRQADDAAVFQIYVSGCSGDITAGKYNDGSTENRARLTERMYRGMVEAWKRTERFPLSKIGFTVAPLVLPHRDGEQTEEKLKAALADTTKPGYARAMAAMGLSSRTLHPAGHEIDVCAVQFNDQAQLVLLPGESLVGYQLLAQQMRPDQFIMAVGYGECSPGYVPTDTAAGEGYAESQGWCWVGPEVEGRMTKALREALGPAPKP